MGLGREKVGAIGTLSFVTSMMSAVETQKQSQKWWQSPWATKPDLWKWEIMISRLATAQFGNGLSMSWPRTSGDVGALITYEIGCVATTLHNNIHNDAVI